MTTSRRAFVTGSAATAAMLSAPGLVRAQPAPAAARTLRTVLHGDLQVFDPIWTTANMTGNHSLLIYDTLFGMDSHYQIQPQMVGGVDVGEDGKRWKLTLRDGLLWHDGEKVLARDYVASIRRWAARDGIGGLLMARTDELSAIDDKTIQFRLKKPFRILPYALGEISTPMCAMMPERLASGDPFKAVKEVVGSGPFRFKADEWVSGSVAVYTKFDRYVRRDEKSTGWTAGGKVVHFERVEWHTSPDDGTSAAAMQSGEMDWWELPTPDLLPVLKRSGHVRVEIKDHNGTMGLLKMNNLQPPFDNPAMRRALLGAVNQKDFVSAIAGSDPSMWQTGVGIFTPGTDMASDAGMQVLNGPRDMAAVRAAIKAAGYNGEKTVLIAPTEPPFRKAMADDKSKN